MAVFLEKMKMLEHRENGRRHRPKRRRRNPPSIADTDCPRKESVSHYQTRRRVQPIQEPIKGGFQFGHDSFKEGHHVGGADPLRWDDVGDCGEDNSVRLGFGADEAEPLLCEDEGDENIAFSAS